MPVFSSNSQIPRPPDQWVDGEVVQLQVELPTRAVPWLEWLAKRWAIPVPVVAADMLVAATSGRYLLAQLTGNHLQPVQYSYTSNSGLLTLNLLAPTVDRLEKSVVPHVNDSANKSGQILFGHLQGALNPQMVSIALTDPDGEKLRKDDESLKIHLPEELEKKINTLSIYLELTKSDIIRNSLLLHIYGRIRYELWTSEGNWRPKRKATKEELQGYRDGSILKSPARSFDEPGIKFSLPRRTEFIQEHGKSVEPTRVFMPALLKQRLEYLAGTHRLPISEYCRRNLVALI